MDYDIDKIWNTMKQHFSKFLLPNYICAKMFWYYLQVYKLDRNEGRINR